jgi:hypothetical protein
LGVYTPDKKKIPAEGAGIASIKISGKIIFV